MLNFIPHAELVIFYQTAGGLAALPNFGGAITGPLKNVRHFHQTAALSDFYTPDAAHTQVVDSNADPVYYNVLNPSASDSYNYPNLNTAYFAVDTDTVRFAFDEIVWKVKDATVPLILLPYYTSPKDSFQTLMAFTAVGSVSEATGTAVAPEKLVSGAPIVHTGTVNIHVDDTVMFAVPTSGYKQVGPLDVSAVSGATTAVISGTYSGTEILDYVIEIDSSGSPDTFKWSKGGVEQATGVAITGTAQDLDNGLKVTFSATGTATLGDTWEFTAYLCGVDLLSDQASFKMTGTDLVTTGGESLFIGWEADGSLSVWNGAGAIAKTVTLNWGTTLATELLGFEGVSPAYVYLRETTASIDVAPELLESLYTGTYLNKLYYTGTAPNQKKHLLTKAATSYDTDVNTPSCLITVYYGDIREILVIDADTAYPGIHFDGFFYTDASIAYKMDLVSVLPVAETTVQDTAIIALGSTIHPNTDTAEDVPSPSTNGDDEIAIAKAHTAYLADWKTSTQNNPYANKVILSTNTTSVFAQSADYPWGLPHPDNPLGFAYKIMNDFLPSSSRFYLVVGDSKDKAFNMLTKFRNIMFIGNVWEEYGQGGLDENAWLLSREAKYDNRLVFTWVAFNDRAYRLGSDDNYNPYLVTATLDDSLITRNGADPTFTTLGVEPGDTVVLAQAGTEKLVTTVSQVLDDTIRVTDILTSTLFSGTSCQIKIYKQYTSVEVKENYILAQSSTNPGLLKQFNRYVKWGSHFISNRWFVPVIVAQKLSLPEHQPLTNIVLNSGSFGEVYGDYDYFEEEDLDALVGAGYYIYTADPNGDLPYCIREVTCGMSTGDVYQGNLNAVTPIRTYAATLFSIVNQHLGKYNIVGDAIERIKLAVSGVNKRYTTNPVANLGTKLKKAVVLTITEAEDGVDIDFEALPQKSLNVIRGRIFVRSDQ